MEEVGDTKKEGEVKEPISILLIEDDPMTANLMKAVLKEHNITHFETGEEALDEYKKIKDEGGSFDWVITDNGLAGKMNGFDLAESIKTENLGNPFVTMVTGSAINIRQENTEEELEEKGIHQLIGKPFPPSELSDSVNLAREFGKQSTQPQTE